MVPHSDSSVVVDRVTKHYGDKAVINDLSLSVGRSETVCVLGPSGSGKSTLLRCINNLEDISAGRVLVNGEMVGYRESGGHLYKLSDRKARTARRKLGMVFQDFALFPHMTARENVTIGPIYSLGISSEEAAARTATLLKRVGLERHDHMYPRALSGGQQQRVAIARALAMEPDVMLFDEPTSALDPELVHEVLKVIKELAQSNMTMLIVTHEVGFAREVSDRVAFMDNGDLVETGPTKATLRSPSNPRVRGFLSQILE